MSRVPRLRVVLRLRAAGERTARFLTGSLAAHGALLAAIFMVPVRSRHLAPISDATVVALAGPIGAAPVASAAPPKPAPSHATATPAPAPPPKEAHAVREVPAAKPKADPKKRKPPVEEPAANPVESPAASRPGADPTPPAAAPTGVTASVGGGDASLGWYSAAVKAALESNWQKPFLEDQGTTHSVTIAFDIARDGTVRNIRVVASSGVASLDRSAQRAAMEASPLPGVPPSWKEGVLPATMRFDLTPEAP